MRSHDSSGDGSAPDGGAGGGSAMTPGRHPVRVDGRWVEVPVAAMGDESLVVPVVAALVFPDDRRERLLLQRRDKPDAVRGRWEIPMGRWRAGETPTEAVTREVEEETGLRVLRVEAPHVRHEAAPERPFLALQPLAVTVGVGGAYPVLHLAFACIAAGDPRPLPGETADPGWVEIDRLQEMLAEPESFTGPALAILRTWLFPEATFAAGRPPDGGRS
ncbi:MAG: NUDIX domain-containing protein [Acidimicrobiia bacterium]|nr:NUDIX domain-containing protein [Acidimicrobiia bacterium]